MATQLKARRIAVLAKVESVYGTDAVPSGDADAILVSNPKLTPMESDRAERDVVRPYFGNAESIPTGARVKFECEVEIAGSGTAGTIPGWGGLLRACAFSETVTEGVKVEYSPVTDPIDSVSIYCNFDGVSHKMLGARGTVSLDFKNKNIPKFMFSFTGIYCGVVDAAMPNVRLTSFKTPVPFDASNVDSLTLHGFSVVTESLSVDMANQIVHRSLPGGSEAVIVTDRKPAGNISFEAVKVAEKDWWTIAKTAVTGALALVHGKTAGNIVEVSAPAVQLGAPDYSDSDGILMLNAPLSFVPGAVGNDEIKIIVK